MRYALILAVFLAAGQGAQAEPTSTWEAPDFAVCAVELEDPSFLDEAASCNLTVSSVASALDFDLDGNPNVFGLFGTMVFDPNDDGTSDHLMTSTRIIVRPGGLLKFATLAASPPGGQIGDAYFNSSIGGLCVHNGTQFVDASNKLPCP